MKLTTFPVAFALAFLPSCVASSADLRDLADRVTFGVAEGADRATLFADELNGLADELDERTAVTTGAITGLKEGGIVGLLGTLAASVVGVNQIRDRRRRKRNEVTGDVLARATPPAAPPTA